MADKKAPKSEVVRVLLRLRLSTTITGAKPVPAAPVSFPRGTQKGPQLQRDAQVARDLAAASAGAQDVVVVNSDDEITENLRAPLPPPAVRLEPDQIITDPDEEQ